MKALYVLAGVLVIGSGTLGAQGNSASRDTPDLCNPGGMTLRVTLNKTTLQTKDASSASGYKVWPTKDHDPELIREISFTPSCAGTIDVKAQFRGIQGRVNRSICLHDDVAQALCKVNRKNDSPKDSGASIRLSINGAEICRDNDGPAGPPAPDTPKWHRGRGNFNEYNLYCPKKDAQGKDVGALRYNVAAGSKQVVDMYMWNTYAAIKPDAKSGVVLTVTFEPAEVN
ncbi:hypothetical protein FHW12_003146 [Dokdonella fugitiva]|uniref:Uncharacterized protein n=1 Tax=Dokdonella fugitiva TaxID=328517 RepID=A0A839F764_9GAMM|nr:hypothetical protein [Dokdonella fugitiva]MBA8888910.1 hypothetical protein [Dokdonella fugitiva]